MARKLTKIVFTGAPSSGKSSTLEALAKRKDPELLLVPESAAILLNGGFPPPDVNDLKQVASFQRTIVQVQRELEEIFAKKYPAAKYMIMDRSLLDAPAFWPPGPSDYFKTFKVDAKKEWESYDWVLFFELPAKEHYGGKHKGRFHSYEESLAVAKKQRDFWAKHPRLLSVPAQESVEKKIRVAVGMIDDILSKRK